MPTRTVVLTEHQQNFVEDLVHSGRYQNANEVLGEGLRLIEQREQMDAAKLAALREAASKGWADVAAGRYLDLADSDLETFVDRLGQQAAKNAFTSP